MDFTGDIARLRLALQGLSGVIETMSYGTPSWKVGKKMLARLREPGVVVLPCHAEADKHLLIETAPTIYFTVSHYDGYPLVLARMEVISDNELRHRLNIARNFLATPKIRKSANPAGV